jgi:hypothetical protein
MKRKLLIAALFTIFPLAAADSATTTTPINVTASATATTGSFSASLAAVQNKTNYICGFVITSGGTTTAAVVNVTATGTISGTLNYAYVFPSSGQGVLGVAFPQCIIASGQNTAITVIVPAGGTGTNAALSVWGYRL